MVPAQRKSNVTCQGLWGSVLLRASKGGRRSVNIDVKVNPDLAGIRIPDSKLAREITELVRDTECRLLFHHSSRVYLLGRADRRAARLTFDPELLYAGAMFHDMGLTHQHSSADERFEVDGANAARDFLRGHGISRAGHRHGLDRDRAAHHAGHSAAHASGHRAGDGRRRNGRAGHRLSRVTATRSARRWCTRIRARGHFKEDIIQAFYDGIKHKPETTFGNVKADVLADKDPATSGRRISAA